MSARHKYLFVLCPPHQGSSILLRLLGTSAHASTLPADGSMMPSVRPFLFEGRGWRRDLEVDWHGLRRALHAAWDLGKPLLVDKGTDHHFRADEIESNFVPAYFIAMVREPFASAEGYVRRLGVSAAEAAAFWVRQAAPMARCRLTLRRLCFIRYEDLCDAPQATCDRLVEFLPELGALDWRRQFRVHSVRDPDNTDNRTPRAPPMKLTNLNREKVARLGPGDADAIERVLLRNEHLVRFCGYSPRFPEA